MSPPTEVYASQHNNSANQEQPGQPEGQSGYPHSVDYDSYRHAQAWSEVADAADTANPAPRTGHVSPADAAAAPNAQDNGGYAPGQASVSGQASEQAAVTLLLQDGSSRTYHVHEGTNIIGRGNQVDFRLPDTGVSRRHAELVWDGKEAVLVDLHSTNGTTVNDTPIDNWLLADGDVITVGHSYIEVRINTTQK